MQKTGLRRAVGGLSQPQGGTRLQKPGFSRNASHHIPLGISLALPRIRKQLAKTEVKDMMAYKDTGFSELAWLSTGAGLAD